MTSQTFLTRLYSQKRAARYSFVSAFGAGIVMINLIFMILYMMVAPMSVNEINLITSNNPNIKYLYFFFLPSNDIMLFFLTSQAMITAVFVFSFMLGKRASTAYLSMPVSRSVLFISKYSAGLIMIFIPTIINMIWRLYINIHVFDFSAQMMKGFAILIFGMVTTLFFVYSVTVAVCMCVGTIAEGFVFTFLLLFGIFFLANGANGISSMLLWGNDFGEVITSGGRTLLNPTFLSYVKRYAYTFNQTNIFEWYKALDSDSQSLYLGRYFLTNILSTVVWFALSLIVSYLAFLAFKRYKAEISGSLGVNRILNFIGTFIIVFYFFGIFRLLIGGLVFSVAVFVLCRFLLTLNIKKAVNIGSLMQLGAMLAIICAVSTIFLTGMFGYSSYLPDISEVKGVSITYMGAPDYIMDIDEVDYSWQGSDSEMRYEVYPRDYNDLVFWTENSESDVRAVLDIHKELIDARPDVFASNKQMVEDEEKDRLAVHINIEYELNNGIYVNRLYKSIPTRILMDMLRLDETEMVNARIEESFDVEPDALDSLPVLITDSLFGNEYMFDEAEKKELFAALKKDITNLSINEKYYPEQQARAIITFLRMIKVIKKDGIESFEYYDGVGSIPGVGIDREVYYNAGTYSIRFYINDAYINTAAFLKEKGLYGTDYTNTPDIGAISEIYVERRQVNDDWSLYFRSYVSGGYMIRKDSLKIEESEYKNILKLARNNYYTVEGGYFVRVLTNDDPAKCITLFMSESFAPDYVKNAVK